MELHLIIGPMFAGKSTELIRIANRYKSIGKTILAINHSSNTRYGTDQITTHNKTTLKPCLITERLSNVSNTSEFASCDVILIEELQFFKDAFENIIMWIEKYNKTVVAAGLDGDINRNMFGDVLKLVPYADSVTKVSALCKCCGDGTLAHFTRRKLQDEKGVIIGGEELYESVCRKHFLSSNKVLG